MKYRYGLKNIVSEQNTNTRDHMLYDFIYRKRLQQANII